MVFLLLIAGLIALVVGAELLVRGASALAAAFGISALIIGLTVVAFGTSAPELAVSVLSSARGQADIALGNVVGSNIFNVLFILGISAVIVPLAISRQLIRVDVPLMVGASGLLLLLAGNGHINRVEGLVLFGGLLSYLSVCYVLSRRAETQAPVAPELPSARHPEDPPVVVPQAAAVRPGWLRLGQHLLLIMAGLALLVLGSHWLVEAAVTLARWLGASELVIGLTIIAAGTSLPEVATSIVAAVRGERDIAVGNVVGSCIFNILGVLGLSAAVSPQGVQVASQALQFDIPVLLAVAVLCLPFFMGERLISRWKGSVLLGGYVAYTVALLLLAQDPTRVQSFRTGLIAVAVPVLGMAFSAVILRSRQPANSTSADTSAVPPAEVPR